MLLRFEGGLEWVHLRDQPRRSPMGHWAPPDRPASLPRPPSWPLPPPLSQFVYAKLVGTFPFNSFLAAFFCCVGAFVLTLSLRMKVAESGGKGGEAEFGGYALAMCTLFIASWNYIG